MSKEKDLIHEICYLFFLNIYIIWDRYLAVTCWLTNTDFLLSVCNCAHVTHMFTLLLCHWIFTAVLCRPTACYLPYNKVGKKKKEYSSLH